jgi:hypothetical protein
LLTGAEYGGKAHFIAIVALISYPRKAEGKTKLHPKGPFGMRLAPALVFGSQALRISRITRKIRDMRGVMGRFSSWADAARNFADSRGRAV